MKKLQAGVRMTYRVASLFLVLALLFAPVVTVAEVLSMTGRSSTTTQNPEVVEAHLLHQYQHHHLRLHQIKLTLDWQLVVLKI